VAVVEGTTGVCGDGVNFELDDTGVLTFSGNGVIDCSTFQGNKNIKSVVVGDDISKIGDCVNSENGYYGCFYNCDQLTQVKFGKNCTSFGWFTFEGCTSLNSVEFSNSFKQIGYSSFKGCTSLTSITIPDSVTNVGYDAFSGCTSLQFQPYNGGKYLGNDGNKYHAFIGVDDKTITSYTVHEKTRVIAGGAFEDCTSLTQVSMPSYIASLGSYAFKNCSSLAEITLPYSVTSIASYAFSNCTSLKSVTLPETVTKIGKYGFSDCSSLTQFVFCGNSNPSTSSNVFDGCSSLSTVTVPKSYGDTAFCGKDIEKKDGLKCPEKPRSAADISKPFLFISFCWVAMTLLSLSF